LTQLLQRCGKDDVNAFETYYRLTSPILATLVAARRLSPAMADAVLVEVYVTIWRRAHTFPDSGCSVWQWTLTILLDALEQATEPEPLVRAR
jgi:DNA-directed RNA polymerase specialized sigma24 family protein